jgi:DNA-binding MarR family transcriptional regulator
MDLIKESGTMTFASRLKRLGDRLKAEATKIYHSHGVEFNDSWFLVAFALSKREGSSVNEIAEMLGISHAAISQMYGAMERKGLLTIQEDPGDRRRKLLFLSETGRASVEKLEPIWDAVSESTDELLASIGLDFMRAIASIEESLDEKSLYERVEENLKSRSERADE